jgi:hypothetical protein
MPRSLDDSMPVSAALKLADFRTLWRESALNGSWRTIASDTRSHTELAVGFPLPALGFRLSDTCYRSLGRQTTADNQLGLQLENYFLLRRRSGANV